MCKGQTSTTSATSSTPNPTALAAYNSLLSQAPQVAASHPYQPYTGQLVAPLNAEGKTGISGINQYSNAAQPAIGQAEGILGQATGLVGQEPGLLGQSASLLQGAAQPLTTGQINQYMSPYTQDVVNATEQQFNLQNAQQQNQVVGNAAAEGALGGNRVGVAQAQLAGQQQTAEAPVIAGLYNTAYGTGLQTAEQEFQANPMAAAYGIGNVAAGYGNAAAGLSGIGQGIGNLGIAGQNAGLQGAGAQLQASTEQEQLQTANDQAALQQWEMQQAFPYQQLSWQAGLDTGVGSLMGGFGTGYTQGPTPSLAGPVAGLGIAALGAFAKDGGRIPEYDAGGAAPGVGNSGFYGEGSSLYGGVGYLPTLPITRGPGPPQPPNSQQQQQQQQATNPLGGINPKAIVSGFKGAQNLWGSNSNDWAGGPEDDSAFDVGGLGEASGGRIPHFDTGGGADDNGVMPPSSGWGSFASSDNFLPPDQPIQVADASGVMPSASDMTSRAETGTDPVHGAGNISPDAGRSLSYGIYGLNSRSGSAKAFENQYGNALGITAAPGTPEFNRQWRDAAARNPQGFADAQYAYYEKNIFPQSQKALEEYGVPDSIKSDPRVQKYMSDRYVQMGTVGLGGAIAGAGYAQTPEQFIHAMSQADRQNLRSNFRTYLSDNPQNVPGLMNRIAMRDRLSGGGDDAGVSSTPLAYSADEGPRGVSTHGLPHIAQAADTSGVASDASPRGGFLGLHLSDAARQGLIGAGLGMMASGSPYPLQQIGQGGLQGLQAYSQAKTRDLAVQRLGIEAQKAQSEISRNTAQTTGFNTENEQKALELGLEKKALGQSGLTGVPGVPSVPSINTPVASQPLPPPSQPQGPPAQGAPPAAVSSSPGADALAKASGYPDASTYVQNLQQQLSELNNDPRRFSKLLAPAIQQKQQVLLKQLEDVNGAIAKDNEATSEQKNARAAGYSNPIEYTARGEELKNEINQSQKTYAGIHGAAAQYERDQKPYLDLSRSLLSDPSMYTGVGANMALDVNRVRAALGNNKAAMMQEALQKVTAGNVLAQINTQRDQMTEAGSQSGRIFAAQVDQVEKAAPQLSTTLGGNRFLVQVAARLGEQQRTVDGLARQFIKEHGHLTPEFDGEVSSYLEAHPLFSSIERSHPELLGAPTVPPTLTSAAQIHDWGMKLGLKPGDAIRTQSDQIKALP